LKTSTRSCFTRYFQYELSGYRLDNVYSICDLGVVLDSKVGFTSHIDSLVVKASRMLGYTIGKELRDPYTLKTLYIIRSVSFASVHLKRIEAIQKQFSRFTLRTLARSRYIELPSYSGADWQLWHFKYIREIGAFLYQ
jgi:hypothetical protein